MLEGFAMNFCLSLIFENCFLLKFLDFFWFKTNFSLNKYAVQNITQISLATQEEFLEECENNNDDEEEEDEDAATSVS